MCRRSIGSYWTGFMRAVYYRAYGQKRGGPLSIKNNMWRQPRPRTHTQHNRNPARKLSRWMKKKSNSLDLSNDSRRKRRSKFGLSVVPVLRPRLNEPQTPGHGPAGLLNATQFIKAACELHFLLFVCLWAVCWEAFAKTTEDLSRLDWDN